MKIWKGDRQLRCGFTTGSCAAAAAKAAVRALLSGQNVDCETILTPKGIPYTPVIERTERVGQSVSCSVRKDGGDDPDVTDGLLITATVEFISGGEIQIDGGPGVGRVTRAGLDQPLGAAAINRVPRRMIEENVREVLREYGRDSGKDPGGDRRKDCGIRVVISVEGGEECAKKTFNPRLGIVGGISILGTSGIVVPMSEKALTDTIRVDMKAQIAQGNGYVIAVPGNYGVRYCREALGIGEEHIVICSNYVGETIDAAVEFGAKGLLLVGHPGKFVKLGAGIMNTHSREADGRMEILAAHLIRCGGRAETAAEILACVTTDEALEVLKRAAVEGQAPAHALTTDVMQSIADSAQVFIQKRAYEKIRTGIILYSFQAGQLAESGDAGYLTEKVKEYA